MKKSKQCPKCHGLRIGHLVDQGDDDTIEGERSVVIEEQTQASQWTRSPFAIGFRTTEAKSQKVVRSEKFEARLEAFVCADCGHFESYVKAPEVVPWDDLVGFSWVNPRVEGAGPYR